MICYAQVPGLSGGHQILALEQVSAIAVNEPLPEAADILLGLPGNAALGIRALAGNSMPSTRMPPLIAPQMLPQRIPPPIPPARAIH